MGKKVNRRLGLKKETLRQLDERQLRAVNGGGQAQPGDQGGSGSNYFTCTCFCNPPVLTRNGGGTTLTG